MTTPSPLPPTPLPAQGPAITPATPFQGGVPTPPAPADSPSNAPWWFAHGSAIVVGLACAGAALADVWYFHSALGAVLDGTMLAAGFGTAGVTGWRATQNLP